MRGPKPPKVLHPSLEGWEDVACPKQTSQPDDRKITITLDGDTVEISAGGDSLLINGQEVTQAAA